MLRRLLLAALAACLAFPALATPQSRDATDMWYIPGESGWGLNLIHQGDMLFATLFVYGQDGQSHWYVASPSGGPTYTGPLFEATGGAVFSASSFDPNAVTRRMVGTITFTPGDTSGTLDYTVDGVHVTKQVIRLTYRATDLTGLHRAFVYQAPANGAAEVRRDLEQFRITDDTSTVNVRTSSDAETDCQYTGNHAENGQLQVVAGTYHCGPPAPAGTQGSWSMKVDPSPSGFVGTFSGNNTPSGRIAAALAGAPKLEGTGWRNGMWFNPNESGWGLNLIEQGRALFATLFVFDAQGRPRWYVASDLEQSGSTSDGTAINSGALYEATGPYFGAASFDPASVRLRQVGTMSFQVRTPGFAVVSYTVDGAAVTKSVTPFAFRTNDPSGAYVGQIADAGGQHDPAVITINAAGNAFAMRLAGMFGGSCDYTGTAQQIGDALYGNGTVQCGFANSPSGGSASFVLKNLIVTGEGVTGRIELSGVSGFVQDGLVLFHFAGARTS